MQTDDRFRFAEGSDDVYAEIEQAVDFLLGIVVAVLVAVVVLGVWG